MKKLNWFFLCICIWASGTELAFAETSLQSLIDQTPENGLLELEGKTYNGNVSITKPITIKGERDTVIHGDATGNVITIDANQVTLKNMTIEHGSLSRSSDVEFSGMRVRGEDHHFENINIQDVYHGLYLNKTKNAVVKNITITGQGTGKLGSQGNGIHLVHSSDITITDSNISQTRDGIYFERTDRVRVENSTVSKTRYGLHYMYSNDNTFFHNRFIKNTGGAAIMHSQGIRLEENQFSFNQGSRSFGLIIQASDENIIKNNEFYLNQRGIYFEQSYHNQVRGNQFFHNDIGVELWSSSANQVFTENHFKQNVAHVLAVGGSTDNHWFENGKGNYWGKELSGFDLDQNKIGDSPVEYTSSLYKLVEENELAYLFLKSPAIGIYEKMNEVMNTQVVMALDSYPLLEEKGQSSYWLKWLLLALLLSLIGGMRWAKQRRRG